MPASSEESRKLGARNERTIRRAVDMAGVALHSGAAVRLRL